MIGYVLQFLKPKCKSQILYNLFKWMVINRNMINKKVVSHNQKSTFITNDVSILKLIWVEAIPIIFLLSLVL